MLAPWDDKTWDIYVLGNQLNCYDGKAITRVFEIHDCHADKPKGYEDWLVKHAPRLTVSESFPITDPKIEIYPKAEVEALLGGHFSSSPAYMIGYAVLQGATEIGIYGVDMAVDDHEYFRQRPDMYAWIGYCMGKGIKVHVPDESSLFKSSYDEGRDWGKSKTSGPFSQGSLKKRCEDHRVKVKKIAAEIKELELDLASHKSAVSVYEHLARVARAVESGAEIRDLDDVTKKVTHG